MPEPGNPTHDKASPPPAGNGVVLAPPADHDGPAIQTSWRHPVEHPSLPEAFATVRVPRSAGFWRTLFAFIGPGLMVAVGNNPVHDLPTGRQNALSRCRGECSCPPLRTNRPQAFSLSIGSEGRIRTEGRLPQAGPLLRPLCLVACGKAKPAPAATDPLAGAVIASHDTPSRCHTESSRGRPQSPTAPSDA